MMMMMVVVMIMGDRVDCATTIVGTGPSTNTWSRLFSTSTHSKQAFIRVLLVLVPLGFCFIMSLVSCVEVTVVAICTVFGFAFASAGSCFVVFCCVLLGRSARSRGNRSRNRSKSKNRCVCFLLFFFTVVLVANTITPATIEEVINTWQDTIFRTKDLCASGRSVKVKVTQSLFSADVFPLCLLRH